MITPNVPDVTALWALVRAETVEEARELLRVREGRALRHHIGMWSPRRTEGKAASIVSRWAEGRRLDGTVWAELPPRWSGVDGRVPTETEVVEYLQAQGRGSEAETYVRRTPSQICTRYRSAIEDILGWTAIGY